MRKAELSIVRASPKSVEEELHEQLYEQGLHAVVRQNDSGCIYGITFTDDDRGIALNGSRLSKGYAANVFNTYHISLIQRTIHSWMKRSTAVRRSVWSNPMLPCRCSRIRKKATT